MKNGCIEFADGDKAWYLNDELHREDGPAIEYADGDKIWYHMGERHREDGPAIELADGDKGWYLDSVEYTEKDYWKELYTLGKISQEQLVLELL